MRALRFDTSLAYDPGHPEPALSDGDTLIAVQLAGICSTDLEICRGYMGFTGILGHEFVGEVLASPDCALVGKRVCGEINRVCGHCDLCRAGLPTHCRNRSVLGILKHNGAFADLVRLPAANLHVLPDAVDNEQAVFVEPLAAAFQILKQITPTDRQQVTVLGDGRLGLLVAQVLRTTPALVRLIGKHPEKLALCAKWSIHTQPLAEVSPRHDQDVVVDCTGSAAGFELALNLVRPRGTIVLKSTVAAGKALNLAPLVIDEVTVVGSRCGPFPDAIEALRLRQIDVKSLIHRRMRLEESVEAMALAGRPGVLKILIEM
jgi:threonine dehydrogenase-like Zn-dependent dehydrogenase